jgi:hypothetical protein
MPQASLLPSANSTWTARDCIEAGRGEGPGREDWLLTWAFWVERVTGIEPAPPAWKAGALPLSYTRALWLDAWVGRSSPQA